MAEAKTRSGTKFICDVPKGYEKHWLHGVPGGAMILTPENGMLPPLRYDRETNTWQTMAFTDD